MSPWFRASELKAPVSAEQMLALEAGSWVRKNYSRRSDSIRKTKAILPDLCGSNMKMSWAIPAVVCVIITGCIMAVSIPTNNRRSTEITSVMSDVVAAMAAESACAITANEILAGPFTRTCCRLQPPRFARVRSSGRALLWPSKDMTSARTTT